MKLKSLPILQLLEHIDSCAERVKSAHNIMSSNGAIIMFLEEATFVEEYMYSIYVQCCKHLPLYEDKGVDRKEAMKLVAKERGISKREVYNYLLSV